MIKHATSSLSSQLSNLYLRTLNQKPSYHNRAHHIDRSACVELRATDLWHLIPPQNFDHSKRRRTFKSTTTLDATATFTITTSFILNLHNKKPPTQLKGDHRTTKSNALKKTNKGANRAKILGLPQDNHPPWSQQITIARYKFPLQNRTIKRTLHGPQRKDTRSQQDDQWIQHFLGARRRSDHA